MASHTLFGAESDGQATTSWWEAWSTALTRPYLLFYESLAQDHSITTRRALLWLAIGGLVSGLGRVATALIYGQSEFESPFLLPIVVFFYPLITIVASVVIIAITNMIAKSFFVGKGQFRDLIRPIAAFQAPLMIIMSVVGLIPIVGLANYGLAVYQIGLIILSVKAVHRIGWGEATVACILFLLQTLQFVTSAWVIY